MSDDEPGIGISRNRWIAANQNSSLVFLVVAALAVRFMSRDFRSGDYRIFLSRWTDYIVRHGGFHAFNHQFANYNVPYLYLLVLVTLLPISHLYGVKLLSVVFDVVMAYYAYRIVSLKYPESYWPKLASAIVFCLPTVVMNSSRWGQADAVYTAFIMGAVFYSMQRRSWAACIFMGLAFSVKLQTAFLFPVLLFLVLRRWISWRSLGLIPVVYLLLDIPALLFGATPRQLLAIYLSQFDQYHYLTMNAANIYQLFGDLKTPDWVRTAGIGATAVIVLVLIAWGIYRRIEITSTRVLLVFTLCSILIPYFLPSMHERYFYPGDVLAVLAAFYLPVQLWVLPLLLQTGSALSYIGAMFPQYAVRSPGERVAQDPPEWALIVGTVAITLALALMFRTTMRDFRSSRHEFVDPGPMTSAVLAGAD